jgi:Cu-Zn family superoxide dismutase
MRTTFLLILALSLPLSACKKKEEEAAKEPETKEATEAPKEEAKAPTPEPPKAEPATAVAKIEPKSGSKVAGTVTFREVEGGTEVEVKLTGLTPGEHGFHIHEKGDCSSDDGKSAGGHYNPAGVDHGAPDAEVHHAGDLGNITADDKGVAEKTATYDFFSIKEDGENNVRGLAVIVHEKPDDLKSQPTGAAGARVGCGVIEAGGAAAEPAEPAEPDKAGEPDKAAEPAKAGE